MAEKYIVNKTKMAYQFQNGRILDRKDTVSVDEKELAELEKDYFFKGLKESGSIAVTSQKPENLVSAGITIASNSAEIEALKKENAELKAKLAAAETLGKDEGFTLDSENPESDGQKKKGGKKE